ncbi:unnamed protein product, partial [Closterium sp. NIES-53]
SRERYLPLVIDDYTRYTTVFPLRSKGQVAHTSMIHAAAPHFLWSFAVRYTVHQLNLWSRVSLPQTSPTLCWTGKVGDASVFRVWGSRAFVRDTSADKLSPRAIPCVFLGFSVPFYRHFPYRSAPPPPPPLFLVPGPPPVDPLLPHGPAPSDVSQVDPLPGPARVQVAVDSGAARGAASGGAESEGAETGGAEPRGVEIGGAEPGGVELRGVATGSGELEGSEPKGGATSSGGIVGASSRMSLQQLREWFVQHTRLRSGASGAGGAGVAGAGGTGVAARAVVTGGTATTGLGGALTRGTGAAGTGGVGGAGAGDHTESGTTNTGGAGAGGAGVGGPRAGGAGVGGPGVGGAGAGGAGAIDPGGTVWPRPYFVPLLQQVLGTPLSAALTPPLLCPPPDRSQPPLQPASPLPTPSPYTEQFGGLIERRELASCPISPVRTARRVPCSRPPLVPGTHAMTLRPSSVPLRSAAASALVAELLDFAASCRLDYATALVAESASDGPLSDEDHPGQSSAHHYPDAVTHGAPVEFVEPSGPYPELVGCLMYLMTCTRLDLAYPLSLLARYVAPGSHRKVHWDAAKRVLRYLCSMSGMGLVLGGRGPVVLTGHADASWVDDSATQRSSQGYSFSLGSGLVSRRSTRSSSVLSSSCEAEIYAGAMAAQELRWLTYLLTDLGEQPRSPPVLYVDNKAMIAMCLEHRTKHIALRYFLARELHPRG